MLGLIGLLILNAITLSDHIKENIGFAVMIKDNVTEIDVLKLQKELDASLYVKETKFVTKDEAAIELKKELGEDFVEFLGYNPLLSSIEVRLYAEYANFDSIAQIEKELKQNEFVKDVFFQESFIQVINQNVRKISFFILLFSIMLTVISIALINNTIRLSIYSKRFLIKTMQLVGATGSFIQRPFLIRSVMQGSISAVIAIIFLIGTLNIIRAQAEFENVIALHNVALLFLFIIIVGIGIAVISTYFAVKKYLRLRSNELYI